MGMAMNETEKCRYIHSLFEIYREINSLPYEEWQKRCVTCNDCSRCSMAPYKDLYSTTKNTCIYGMPYKKFKREIEECGAYLKN